MAKKRNRPGARREPHSASADGASSPVADPVSTRRLEQALEALRSVMVEAGPSGVNLYVSPSLSSVLGYAPEEVVGRVGLEFVHEDDRGVLVEMARQLAATRVPVVGVIRTQHKSGHWIWLEVTSSLIETEGDLRTISFARDVSEARAADEVRRATEDRFRTVTENAIDLIMEIDDRGRFLFVSPNSEAILGTKSEDMVGRSFLDFASFGKVHPEDRERMSKGFANTVTADGRRGVREFRFLSPDGSWHWFESQFRTYRNEEGAWRAVVVSRDISERRRAEAGLRESEERYRLIAEATQEIICEVDNEGRTIYASPAIQEVLGFAPEDVEGTTTAWFMHPDDVEGQVDAYLEATREGVTIETGPFQAQHRDGSWRWLEGHGIPFRRAEGELHYLYVVHDITERREVEEQRRALADRMQQAQRLEGLGVMAGGIAHDFNNLLTPILGDASLALMDLPGDSPVRVRLEKIQTAARRAASLTNQMLAYAGKGPLLVESLDLSDLVREMAQLLETSLGRRADLVYELAEDLPPVQGDVAQLSQVVMNLLTNAAEAMSDGGGRIAIRTGSFAAGAQLRGRHWLGGELAEGPAVYVEVEDDGCGMDEETRARIFDPFFTTKFTGRGLGLAAALGIVRGHSGAIEIESEPGVGTRFRMMLPATDATAAATLPTSQQVADWRASGLVLVVDDDAGVRELARETLERAGLRVLCAEDGRRGLELFGRHAAELRLVILDSTMPTATGGETFGEIRRLRPDVPILLVSGYSEERAAHLDDPGPAEFLQKPFQPETLLESARRLVEA